MKGVVLAGGTGSRLDPVTRVTNKHLLPVGRLPMIYYPIFQIRDSGISDILIVTGREHMGDVMNLLGSGSELNLRFTYRVQDRAGGIAEALGLAREFVGDDKVMVILGDNIFQDRLARFAAEFENSSRGAMLLLKEVADPWRFGTAKFSPDRSRIEEIVEKPGKPPSNFVVTGAYFYDNRVFEIISQLEPSPRGELEITDVNNAYIKRNDLEFRYLEGFWSDAGTFESLARVNQFLMGDKERKLPGMD